MGLYADENYLVFRWTGPGTVLFSVARRGDAASCHFASDKAGLRHLKQAIEAWCRFAAWLFDWCRMILAQVKRPSVGRLIEKCGFRLIGTIDDMQIYMRKVQWAE